MKKNLALFLFLCGILFSAEAQQLTRFAVVDLTRVYTAFFRESRAVREFEDRSARVQSEIDRMTAEVQEIKLRQTEAALKGEDQQALRLESEVNRKSEYLREYYRLRTQELEDQKKRLAQSGTFLDQVYDEIRFIAESEGYSMVLNLKENTGILWFSPTVDVTDKVIENLRSKAGR